jgi:hypothetical protein
MKYTVWHAIVPTFGIRQVTIECWPHPNYAMVAEVEASNLEEVFELTNHIDHDWTTNRSVKVIGDKHRSTSVGDIVEVNGHFWLCENCGWTAIEFPHTQENWPEDYELESRRHEDQLEHGPGMWDFLDDDEGFRT